MLSCALQCHYGGPEVQTFVYDGAGEVRNSLLGAPKWMKSEAMVPENTITVSVELEDINDNTAVELSNNASAYNEHGAFAELGLNSGYNKAGMFTTLSSINQLASPVFSNHERPLGEQPNMVTFMYDSEHLSGQSQETVILPSAMLI